MTITELRLLSLTQHSHSDIRAFIQHWAIIRNGSSCALFRVSQVWLSQ